MNHPKTVTFHTTAVPDGPNTLLTVAPRTLMACRVAHMSITDLRRTIWQMQSVIDAQVLELHDLRTHISEHYDAGCSVEGDVFPDPD